MMSSPSSGTGGSPATASASSAPRGGDPASVEGRSLLSDKAIRRHMKAGTVVIAPFVEANLGTSSYDITLGPNYFRESTPEAGALRVYNPYSRGMVESVWGEKQRAERAGLWMERNRTRLENIDDDDLIIWVCPGETILGHTNEFIGGRGSVTTMMKARSSLGRNFIELCKCAGWGDVGYVNRWTVEITNNSRNYSIPLVVGRRVGQIVFFDTDGTERSYADTGKYQTTGDFDAMVKAWRPEDMLPRMYLDRDIVSSSTAARAAATGDA